MIEKITTEYPDFDDLKYKINELVDAVNGILDYAPLELAMKAEPTENAYTKTCRMDKEFAEDECVRLQKELDHTRKALDVAVDALKLISLRYLCEYADKALDQIKQITALEQKE